MRRPLGILATVLLLGALAFQVDPFAEIERRYELTLGVAAYNLTTGASLFYRADTLFPTASVIKLAILVELYRQYERGYLSPQDTVVLTSGRIYPGSGVLQHLSVPRVLSLQDAAVLMIILSDNTATNLVFDRLGPHHDARLDSVNATLQLLGLRRTRMLNKPFGFSTRKNTPEARRYGIGMGTPRELMHLLVAMVRGSVVTVEASREMIEILKRQQWAEMAPRLLPVEADTLQVAHKNGAISTARCDVGLIFSPRDTIAFAVMTDHIKDPRWSVDQAGNLAVAEAVRVVYERLHVR